MSQGVLNRICKCNLSPSYCHYLSLNCIVLANCLNWCLLSSLRKQTLLISFFSSLWSELFQSSHCPRLPLAFCFNSSLSSCYRFSQISLSAASLQCLYKVFLSLYLILTSCSLVPNRGSSFNKYSMPVMYQAVFLTLEVR